MAWNEPGRGGKDPWGDKGGNGSGRRGGGNQPDLDELVRNLQRKLSGLFGGGGGGKSTSSGNGSTITLLFVLLAIAWLGSGLYQIDAAETGVITRFGAFQTTTPPGLHWHLPWPIEKVEKVDIAEIARFPYQTLMLTKDENIVTIDVTVQYRRADPVAYLFNVRTPDQTLADVTESAIREVVGKNTMDFILGPGRSEVAAQTKELVQSTLTAYGTGVEVTSVNLQDANFPEPVQPAVRDAIKAREDRERLELEAQKYANEVLPRARGEAARRLENAEAYKAEVIAEAQGETARFVQLLEEYAKAPNVTRERLYLQAMERVLGSTSKVLVTAEGSNNMMYLPLDQLLKQQKEAQGASGSTSSPANRQQNDSDRSDARSRGGR
ncbi:MAG: FtsH protease activity modulator HflK [Proteobacteria bacterium]|nr:FtsH protease activity modulator HflK [Pseudomonadota bacterium]